MADDIDRKMNGIWDFNIQTSLSTGLARHSHCPRHSHDGLEQLPGKELLEATAAGVLTRWQKPEHPRHSRRGRSALRAAEQHVWIILES